MCYYSAFSASAAHSRLLEAKIRLNTPVLGENFYSKETIMYVLSQKMLNSNTP